MQGLDKFFNKGTPAVHPKVAYWHACLKKKQANRLRVTFQREKSGLVFEPAKLYVHFQDAAGEDVQTPDEVDWDERINSELIKLKANALSKENEAERFGMVFNDRLALAENRFGDGFYNATLVAYLKQSAFAKLPETSGIVNELNEYAPSQGRQRQECEEMIEEEIGYCITSLHDSLEYSQNETTMIVANSLAYYLDERFSISDRKLLGWSR